MDGARQGQTDMQAVQLTSLGEKREGGEKGRSALHRAIQLLLFDRERADARAHVVERRR